MDKYLEFNACRFLNDSKKWGKQKRALEDELNGIVEIKGASDNVIHTGRVSDTVPLTMMQRHEKQLQIDRIDKYIDTLKYVRRRLTDAQNDVIDVFFFRRGYKPPLIEEYGRKYGLCRSDVYKARREALDAIRRIITEGFL